MFQFANLFNLNLKKKVQKNLLVFLKLLLYTELELIYYFDYPKKIL